MMSLEMFALMGDLQNLTGGVWKKHARKNVPHVAPLPQNYLLHNKKLFQVWQRLGGCTALEEG